MKSSICLLIASSVLALPAPTSKEVAARTIYTYAVKDYENEKEAEK
ncbi:hypothetical protein SUNI508_03358 [Seiridium unicorne]|uniref:Uncharacterized protein n=1 Tax=Seiridium unicorne TaxID=138068 RepID=A0ABR2VF02_9PEZI